MLILIYGEDDFRLKEKFREIVSQYRAKYQSGINIFFFEGDCSFSEIKSRVEVVSMFEEKKLIVLKNCLSKKVFLDELMGYFKKRGLREDKGIIFVALEEGKFKTSAALKSQLGMFEEFAPLQRGELLKWVLARAKANHLSLPVSAAEKMAFSLGGDLWQMANEIDKLAAYAGIGRQFLSEKDIDDLVKAKFSANIFEALDALAQKDKKKAAELIRGMVAYGENEIYLFSMITYQIRTLLKIKDLMDQKISFDSLISRSRLHPFVVKKSSRVLNGFSLEQLKKISRRLLEMEKEIKKGRLEGAAALDLLIAEF